MTERAGEGRGTAGFLHARQNEWKALKLALPKKELKCVCRRWLEAVKGGKTKSEGQIGRKMQYYQKFFVRLFT